jgi:AcrR family transcriptional regulator
MTDEAKKPTRLQRRIEMFWGDRERTTQRGPRPGLTLEQIARKAIAIADAEGLGAVTMQRLANELGFSTMALYRYVATKDDLIALMVDHSIDEMPDLSATAGDWRGSLTTCAHALLGLYHLHPWTLMISIDGVCFFRSTEGFRYTTGAETGELDGTRPADALRHID